jgi:hypothetical protein
MCAHAPHCSFLPPRRARLALKDSPHGYRATRDQQPISNHRRIVGSYSTHCVPSDSPPLPRKRSYTGRRCHSSGRRSVTRSASSRRRPVTDPRSASRAASRRGANLVRQAAAITLLHLAGACSARLRCACRGQPLFDRCELRTQRRAELLSSARAPCGSVRVQERHGEATEPPEQDRLRSRSTPRRGGLQEDHRRAGRRVHPDGLGADWCARMCALRDSSRAVSASGPGVVSTRCDHAAKAPAVSRATCAHVARSPGGTSRSCARRSPSSRCTAPIAGGPVSAPHAPTRRGGSPTGSCSWHVTRRPRLARCAGCPATPCAVAGGSGPGPADRLHTRRGGPPLRGAARPSSRPRRHRDRPRTAVG